MLVTKQVQTELINMCCTKTSATMRVSAWKNTVGTKSKSSMWSAWTRKVADSKDPRRVRGLNRTCYAQTEKATLLRTTSKNARWSKNSYSIDCTIYAAEDWTSTEWSIYLCVEVYRLLVQPIYRPPIWYFLQISVSVKNSAMTDIATNIYAVVYKWII